MTRVRVEASFWDFSLRAYPVEGVSDACLWLQDERGADVNLLLFCIWAGATRGSLDVELLARAGELSRGWQERVVGKLRAARRKVKSGGEAESHRALGEEVQRLELEAEKLEQEALESLVREMPPVDLTPSTAAEAAWHNLRACFDANGIALDSEAESRLTRVLEGSLYRSVGTP